jgi:replicative DNA helicase
MACVSWLEAIAVEQNIPCMVFPLEMGRKKFMTRLLLGRAKIDTQKYMTHEFERREFERIHEAERELSKSTILWDHSAFIDIATLRARVQVAHREHGVKVVFIDHLGQLKPSTKEGISDFLTGEREIMEGLHSLRRELGIVIILAVQLNKAATANKPKGNLSALTDVKGASEKYEYATHVVFIKRPCLDTPWNKLSRERQDEWELTTRRYRLGNPTCWTQGIDVPDYMTVGEKDYEEHAYFSFIKNRNGPPADQVCVRFRGEYQRFAPRTMKVYESDLDKRPVSLPTFY